MKRITYIILFVILPICLGGSIYIIFRVKSLKMFSWFLQLNLSNEIELVRNHFSNYYLPHWILYNLPDFLWVFSFTSILLIIWNYTISRANFIYIFVPMLIGILSELGQFFSMVSGTFDKIDLLFYLFGGLTSIKMIAKLNLKNNEKALITSS